MFQSAKEMFQQFDQNLEGVVAATAERYEVAPAFVRRYIKHLYDDQRSNPHAHAYFEAEFGLFHRTFWYLRDLQTKFALDLKGAAVLDVGCSDGHSLRAYAKLGANRIVGLEYDAFRFQTCQYILTEHKTPARAVHGSILDADLVERCGAPFDLVTCFDVLEHVPSMDGAVASFAKLLKPGGIILTTIGNRYFPVLMRQDPHWGLPGITLLAPEPARQYFDAVKTGPYDVFDWATRGQLEAIFQRHGFSLTSQSPPAPNPGILAEVDQTFAFLRAATYPNDTIKSAVVQAVATLEGLKRDIANPEDFFGSPLVTIVGCLGKLHNQNGVLLTMQRLLHRANHHVRKAGSRLMRRKQAAA